MRKIRGFSYEDALETRKGHCLFWPGCSLASYSQELTEAVFSFLKERGLVDGLSVGCCGNIVRYAAGYEPFKDFTVQLVSNLIEQGVTSVITSCPNCYLTFKRILRDTSAIELSDLSTILAQEGLRVPVSTATSFCIHDSCPDKRIHVIAPAVRTIFEEVELHEMVHNQNRSRCCGLGKLRFLSDPEESESFRSERIKEFKETAADQLVTCCFSCANAFQDPEAGVEAVHYLELLFGIRIDWEAVIGASQQAQIDLQSS